MRGVRGWGGGGAVRRRGAVRGCEEGGCCEGSVGLPGHEGL